VRLSDEQHPQLDEMAKVSAKAAITNIEAYAIHRELLAAHAADYDPFVRGRLEGGRDISAADYVALMRARAVLVREMDARLSDLDGLVLPTTPIVAPTIAEVSGQLRGVHGQATPRLLQHQHNQFFRSLRSFAAAAARRPAPGRSDACRA
jgi:Asp-tRNA(Asn)/Glu-tRNA(Gln) amidotransferase A subunit family amidase